MAQIAYGYAEEATVNKMVACLQRAMRAHSTRENMLHAVRPALPKEFTHVGFVGQVSGRTLMVRWQFSKGTTLYSLLSDGRATVVTAQTVKGK